MKVKIISIGDELVSGAIVDTNSAYLAEQSESLGMKVNEQCCVGDNLDDIIFTISEAGQRADVVLVTGGLGPTPDDLTSEAAAKSSQKDLILFPEILQSIQNFFKKIGREMPASNKKQAYFPAHAKVLDNPIGSAPGFTCQIGKALFYFMPGVPREMKKMFSEQVVPRIKESFAGELGTNFVSTFSTFGLSEAIIGQHLKKIGAKFPEVRLGTRFDFPVVQIKIYVKGKNINGVQELIKSIQKELINNLGDWIYAESEFDLAYLVNSLAREKPFSLSIVGDISASYLISWLTNFPDSSNYLKSLILLPTEMGECELLSQLKTAVVGSNNSGYGLAITGVFEGNGSLDHGLVKIYLLHCGVIERYECILPFGEIEYKKKMFANLALDILRRKLLGLNCLNEILGKNLIKTEVEVGED
jgi:nicotinamide-nucleotide amidase